MAPGSGSARVSLSQAAARRDTGSPGRTAERSVSGGIALCSRLGGLGPGLRTGRWERGCRCGQDPAFVHSLGV